jgi:hypothetical protein
MGRTGCEKHVAPEELKEDRFAVGQERPLRGWLKKRQPLTYCPLRTVQVSRLGVRRERQPKALPGGEKQLRVKIEG